ncbi:MAG: DUF1501 domain-containing protein [Planctomycetota bacterium]|nr:DUF1501 domain-containing protein [Planctomycetota bacterium]
MTLTICGNDHQKFCDGVSRRQFLQIGGLALGGLSLPDLLRLEAGARTSHPHKSIIMVFLAGGPPHLDTFDLKPDAPKEVRGEFEQIATTIPGLQICELMPRLAAVMNKTTIIRSVVDSYHDHAAFHCLTGRPRNVQAGSGAQPAGGWPALGSILSKVGGAAQPGVPPFVSLTPKMQLETWADPGSPGFLGVAHAPFRPVGAGMQNMVLQGIDADRLGNRKLLLRSLDNFRREIDATGAATGLDEFTSQALGILTSSRLLEALDVSREDPRVRARYGKGRPKLFTNSKDEYPASGDLEHFLIARRLVEAGARCVTMNFGKYDWHMENFREAKLTLPLLDQGVAALIEDLYERGLDRDVTVIVWGEFGRSPKINVNGGRDHWPNVMSALLAGGGLRMGQVIGSTDRLGEEAKDRPIRFQEVFATLYHALGIDLERTLFNDLSGRPQYLLDHRAPISELI